VTRARGLLGSADRGALLGAAIIVAAVVLAALAPLLASSGPRETVGAGFGAPSGAHPLGLDDGGADVLSILLHGARVSLLVGFAASVIAVLIGGAIGVVAGYVGGRVELVLVQLCEFALVIPTLPLIITVAALWGATLQNLILVIGLLSWAGTALLIRAEVRSVRQRAFVRRAEALGSGHARIVLRHVLPQVMPLLAASATLTVGGAIFAEAALSFLGLGDPSRPSWGKMIASAFNGGAVTAGAWWAIAPPGIAIGLVVLASSLLGRALEDAANPRVGVFQLGGRRRERRPVPAAPEAAA
jgi:peptide/nickel transport system permease protein